MPGKNEAAKKQYKSGGYFCVGLGVLFILWSLNLLFSIPRESELIEASGVPKALEAIERRGRYGDERTTLTFQLDGHPTKYADHSPHYDLIAGVLKANKPVKAWLSPRPESIFPVTDKVPIYKFESDGTMILTYPEAVEDEQFLVRVTSIVGAAFVLVGVWSFSLVRWQDNLAKLHDSIKQ
ncbi:MAG: hypothetical protein JSS83_02565 [Cyanobacteria bacterium SZAS LIN-3]|nr:hypothetical protein [Cyanobacteria bacterium SZAS LIN-3]